MFHGHKQPKKKKTRIYSNIEIPISTMCICVCVEATETPTQSHDAKATIFWLTPFYVCINHHNTKTKFYVLNPSTSVGNVDLFPFFFYLYGFLMFKASRRCLLNCGRFKASLNVDTKASFTKLLPAFHPLNINFAISWKIVLTSLILTFGL